MSEPVLRTERLVLRELGPEDAPFIRALLNEPSFLQYIGDRGVRTDEDAVRYIEDGPRKSYARHGFGLYRTELAETGEPIGICGLLRRDTLDDVDIGFAFFPRHWRKGYGREAASAVLRMARERFSLSRVVAITSLDNGPSIALLGQLGFVFERLVRLGPTGEELRLFGHGAPPAARPSLDVVLKRFEAPDEVRSFPRGRLELVRLGGMTIARASCEPGWKWSEHVGPAVGAPLCTVEHVGLVLSGTATCAFGDGRVVELRAGSLFSVPPVPHDSWVVGDEPYVSLHFLGAEAYAR